MFILATVLVLLQILMQLARTGVQTPHTWKRRKRGACHRCISAMASWLQRMWRSLVFVEGSSLETIRQHVRRSVVKHSHEVCATHLVYTRDEVVDHELYFEQTPFFWHGGEIIEEEWRAGVASWPWKMATRALALGSITCLVYMRWQYWALGAGKAANCFDCDAMW